VDSFLNTIIKNKTKCFFISPHLDDAVLSAGQLLMLLAKKVPVVPITVFTEATMDRPTISAKQFLKYSGYQDAEKLFLARKKEDMTAMQTLGLQAKNLGYVEAMWRRKTSKTSKFLGNVLPEFAYVYPIYRFLITSGRIAKSDEKLKKRLISQLQEVIGKDKNYLVFAPLGVGGHVDHVLVRKVCEKAFEKRLVYWSDFPYNKRTGFVGRAPVDYREMRLSVDMKAKSALIKKYKSQIKGLFDGKSIPVHEEVYFIF